MLFPFVLLLSFLSLVYLSINDLPFLQFASNFKSDSVAGIEAVDSESQQSDLDQIRLRQIAENVTIVSGDSEAISANAYPYEPPLIINNVELCKNSPDLDWIVYVYSSGKDFEERLLIRNTWANLLLFKNFSSKIIFLLGRGSDDVQTKVEEEFGKYKDIVQGDFVDSYNNLTLKAVMALRWISTYCPDVHYAIKADEDTFVNVFEIVQLLKENRNKSSVIICNIFLYGTMPILRDPKDCYKSCVRDTEFPGAKFYPQYCSGPLYIISGKLIKQLYEASKSTPFFYIEDVYVTGLLTQKIPDKIDYVNLATSLRNQTTIDSYKNLTQPIKYYVIHGLGRNIIVDLWNALLDRLTSFQKALLQQDVSSYRVQ